jgi:hypothetical protein
MLIAAIHIGWLKLKNYTTDKPFILRGDYLNDREKMLVDRRIEKLNQQIKHEYSLPKLLRKPRFIETSFQTIATLKKYNVPYAIAKFYKNTLEAMRKAPGTYFKIKAN